MTSKSQGAAALIEGDEIEEEEYEEEGEEIQEEEGEELAEQEAEPVGGESVSSQEQVNLNGESDGRMEKVIAGDESDKSFSFGDEGIGGEHPDCQNRRNCQRVTIEEQSADREIG